MLQGLIPMMGQGMTPGTKDPVPTQPLPPPAPRQPQGQAPAQLPFTG